jgi:hypothetical protein
VLNHARDKRSLWPRSLIEHARQRLSPKKLHDEIRTAVGRDAEVFDANDVLAAELRGDASLSAKTRDEVLVLRGVRLHELDRDIVSELTVPAVPNLTHRSFAKGSDELPTITEERFWRTLHRPPLRCDAHR